MKKILILIIFGSIYLSFSQAINAQSYFPMENGVTLKGISEFDANVGINSWLDVEIDINRFRSNLESAFHLGLRRDGVVVSESAPNFLFCVVNAAERNGIIMYYYEVQYYIWNLDGLNILAWHTGGTVTIGRNSFSAQEVAKDCVDKFSNEWLKQNPRR